MQSHLSLLMRIHSLVCVMRWACGKSICRNRKYPINFCINKFHVHNMSKHLSKYNSSTSYTQNNSKKKNMNQTTFIVFFASIFLYPFVLCLSYKVGTNNFVPTLLSITSIVVCVAIQISRYLFYIPVKNV